jgi:hypothetical protein
MVLSPLARKGGDRVSYGLTGAEVVSTLALSLRSNADRQQQLLAHFDESGVYTEALLEPFKERLNKLKDIIKQDYEDGKHPEPILRLMMRKLEGTGESRYSAAPCENKRTDEEQKRC